MTRRAQTWWTIPARVGVAAAGVGYVSSAIISGMADGSLSAAWSAAPLLFITGLVAGAWPASVENVTRQTLQRGRIVAYVALALAWLAVEVIGIGYAEALAAAAGIAGVAAMLTFQIGRAPRGEPLDPSRPAQRITA